MQFRTFSQYLQNLENTAPRLEKTAILAELFSDLVEENKKHAVEEENFSKNANQQPTQIPIACYLMQGSLVPRYKSLEFQLSVKMVLKAIARVMAKVDAVSDYNKISLFNEIDFTNLEKQTLKRYKKLGDVGLVIEEVLSLTSNSPQDNIKTTLSLSQTYNSLVEIAQDSGSGSQDRKVALMVKLFMSLDATSAKFVSRIIIGKLRLGFSTMTIMDALSWTKNQDKSDAKILDLAYQKKADIGKLASLYLLEEVMIVEKTSKEKTISSKARVDSVLDDYSVEVGVPVVPALCQRLNTSGEIIDKMGEVLVEPKYDGLRIQIHIKKSSKNPIKNSSGEAEKMGNDINGLIAKAYTRNLEDVSHMFPELIQAANQLTCNSCILDAEAIGFNPTTGKLLPFQETITRKRKHGVAEQASSVPIRFYVFDILAVDDISLLDERLDDRKKALTKLLGDPEDQRELEGHGVEFENKDNKKPLKNTFYITTTDPVELRQFHESQLGDGLEGAVIKKIDSQYRSGRKGWRWVKIKEEEGSRGKLSDTIDCVVMGYYSGRGKRAEFGMGALLVGVIDEGLDAGSEDDEYNNTKVNNSELQVKTIAKIGTGLTDVQLVEIKKLADDCRFVKTDTPMVHPSNYSVAKNLYPDVWIHPNIVVEIAADEITRSPIHTAGKALRFPRLVKVRGDKNWEQATTMLELESIK